MKITNTQAGPRGFYALNDAHSGSNSIVLAPGETVDVEMTEGELRASRATGWFNIEIDDPEAADEEPEAEVKKPRRGRPRKAAEAEVTEVAPEAPEAVEEPVDEAPAINLEG